MKNFFRHGELPLVLLYLLSRERFNGYELLEELDRLFGPHYRASPGSVYPALKALLKEKLLSKDGDGYRVTAAGAAALEKRAPTLAELEVRTGVHLRSDKTLRTALERFVAEVATVEGLVDPNKVEAILDNTGDRIRRLVKRKGEI